MPYVQRNPHGKVVATYASPQPGRAEEFLSPDHPDITAMEARMAKESAELIEIAWRNEMLRKVCDGLDQLRNDAQFGSQTYNKPYTAQQLNDMRVILCNYPEQPGFPFIDRPTIPQDVTP